MLASKFIQFFPFVHSSFTLNCNRKTQMNFLASPIDTVLGLNICTINIFSHLPVFLFTVLMILININFYFNIVQFSDLHLSDLYFMVFPILENCHLSQTHENTLICLLSRSIIVSCLELKFSNINHV